VNLGDLQAMNLADLDAAVRAEVADSRADVLALREDVASLADVSTFSTAAGVGDP
jgi:hypothetical protein